MQAAEKNLIVYSPSPEYPAACCRDERQRGPAEARQSEGGLGYGEFRFDTPQLAAGSFIPAACCGELHSCFFVFYGSPVVLATM